MVDDADVTIERITTDDAATACDALFREYMQWLVDQLADVHDFEFGTDAQEQVHVEFRKEWPKLFGERGRLLLARIDGEPVGVGALKPVDATSVECKRMYVRPTHSGRGIGRLLLERLITDARSLGYTHVQLETLDFMTSAHALYRSVGFVETGRFDGFEGAAYGVGRFERYMLLDLTR